MSKKVKANTHVSPTYKVISPQKETDPKMAENGRIRIVTLGGKATGKTAIVKRFMFNTFQEKYKSTVVKKSICFKN